MTKKATPQAIEIAETITTSIELPTELTPRQARIIKMRMRGLTQEAIAKVEQVSQPAIAKELKKIKKVFEETGKQLNQDEFVGESLNFYQEIEHRSWDLYNDAKNEKSVSGATKALQTLMTARKDAIRLLMDLGIVKRAPVEHDHNFKIPPFLKKWEDMSDDNKDKVIDVILAKELPALEAPVPPPEFEDYDELDEDEND